MPISGFETTNYSSYPMHFLSKIPTSFTPFTLAPKESMKLSQKFFIDLVALCTEQEKALSCQYDSVILSHTHLMECA